MIGTDPESPTVEVDGQDVSAAIRTSQISAEVSRVAVNLQVRAELRQRQREIIEAARRGPRAGCVAEGRDVTTVVAPEAEVRVLLTADEPARLRRRSMEVHGRDDEAAIASTRDEVQRRDADDSRVAEFLHAADGVVYLDSSALSREQTVQAVLAVVVSAGERTGVVPR